MRRYLHAVLVGCLALSMSTNAARACWYLRHGCRARQHVVVAYPSPTFVSVDPAVGDSCGGWGNPMVNDCGDWQIVSDVAVGESIEEGLSSCDCCGIVVASESEMAVENDGSVSSSSVMEPAVEHLAVTEHAAVDAAGITEPIAAPQPTLAEPADEVPVLKPTDEVRQTVAIDEPATDSEAEVLTPAKPLVEAGPAVVTDSVPPLEEDVPDVELPDAAPPVPVVPAETNIFDEVDQAAAGTIAPQTATEFMPADGSSSDATPDNDRSNSEPQPAKTPAEDLPTTESSPAGEPAAPGDPFDAASIGPQEPARRWIDRSGDYAVVGTLREVRGDGTCVLDTDGRTIRVPLAALSAFDRTYARNAAIRLAADRAPESNDTAGL